MIVARRCCSCSSRAARSDRSRSRVRPASSPDDLPRLLDWEDRAMARIGGTMLVLGLGTGSRRWRAPGGAPAAGDDAACRHIHRPGSGPLIGACFARDRGRHHLAVDADDAVQAGTERPGAWTRASVPRPPVLGGGFVDAAAPRRRRPGNRDRRAKQQPWRRMGLGPPPPPVPMMSHPSAVVGPRRPGARLRVSLPARSGGRDSDVDRRGTVHGLDAAVHHHRLGVWSAGSCS